MVTKNSLLGRVPGAGIILTVASCLALALQALFSKLANKQFGIHALEVLGISCLFGSICYFWVLIFNKLPILGVKNERIYLTLRSIISAVSLSSLWLAYREIPLGDATAIRFSEPIFVNIFAFLLIKEPFGLLQIMTAIVTIAGVTILGRPSFLFPNEEGDIPAKQRLIGIGLSLSGAIFSALSTTLIKRMSETPGSVKIFWWATLSSVASFVYVGLSKELILPRETILWLYIVASSVCCMLNQILLTIALQIESAGLYAIFRTLTVVFAFVLALIFLGEQIAWTSLVGTTLIIGCVVTLGLIKWMKSRDQSETKPTSNTDSNHNDIVFPNIDDHRSVVVNKMKVPIECISYKIIDIP